ncbi:MAG: glycoside hydrolase family 65 protein [Pseudomonadota bacterium]
MGDWSLAYDSYDPKARGLHEVLCTLGNGYFCTRGAFTFESASDVHYPGTYIPGGYNRLSTPIADRQIENEDLVNFPNWLCLTFRPADGDWLSIDAVTVLSFRQELDLQRGVLTIDLRVRDQGQRETAIVERRLVSMADPHLAAIEFSITPENWGGPIEVASALDGRVINYGVKRYRDLNSKHLEVVDSGHVFGELTGEQMSALVVQTTQSKLRVGLAARTRMFRDGRRLQPTLTSNDTPGYPEQVFTIGAEEGQSTRVEKVVALYSSKDKAISEPGLAARELADEAPDFDALLERHGRAWHGLWRRSDVETESDDPEMQMIVRLHILQLLQTVSPHTIDVDAGTPARGWHGEAYRGHIFWDELYILPFLDTHCPEISRSLLRYRYHRLPKACSAAARAGHEGAMYPWQSGSDGREESQIMHLNPRSGHWVPDFSWQQRHVNLAIAFNIWTHYRVTSDRAALETGNAEVLIQIARLFASLAQWNEKREGGRYEIHQVMGPDEFHEAYPDSEEHGLRNNAYTNVMVSWLMQTALRVLDVLDDEPRDELIDHLSITPNERERWDHISRRIYVPFHRDGIISQFEGYDELMEFDWAGYRARYVNIQRLDRILEAEGDSADRYKLAKQADALMLFYLFDEPQIRARFDRLGYPFSGTAWLDNVDYYLRRTSHGSTLSFLVHAWVLARHKPELAWEYLQTALNSDVGDIQGGTTAEGIHLGLMAGTVDLVQRGLTGFQVNGDVIVFNPRLIGSLRRISTRLQVFGHGVLVEVTRDAVTLEFDIHWRRRTDRIRVEIAGQVEEFQPGVRKTVALGTSASTS